MSAQGVNLEPEVGQFSHPGRKRTKNEDWLGTFQPEDEGRLAAKGRLFVVADGMGGHRSGELASRRAVDHIIRTYFDDPDPDVAASLERAIQAANATLYAAAPGEHGSSRSGTTVVAAIVRDRGPGPTTLWIANVGDSRAYLFRGRVLNQLSRDHSWAAAGLGDGEFGRHVVTRALGIRPEVKVDISPFSLQPGDQLLLCSDGLTGPLADPEIQAILERHEPQAAAQRLIEAANHHGGPDNVSVIVVRLPSQPSSWKEAWAALLSRFWPSASNEPVAVGPVTTGLPNWVLIAAVLLAILSLVGLGFVVGRVLF